MDLPSASVPDAPLEFILACIAAGRVRWTYHVTMRLDQRKLTARVLRDAAATLEIIERYPHDKYLPSFLLRGERPGIIFHTQIATDVADDNIRVITMYEPDPNKWDAEFRVRRIR